MVTPGVSTTRDFWKRYRAFFSLKTPGFHCRLTKMETFENEGTAAHIRSLIGYSGSLRILP